MRKILLILTVLLGACSAAEPEVLTTSVDVDQSKLAALLADIDAIAENDLPLEKMTQLAITTAMDSEQQERFPITFDGNSEDVLFHIWREQQDWLHLYFSSTSKGLIDALERSNAAHARDDVT